jgi:hypothetical protein
MKFQAMNIRTIALLALGFLTATVFLPAREIGFVEKFSLAEDRAKALDDLVTGTQDYYYYSALHALTRQNFKEVQNLLNLWLKRYGSTPRSKEIENRMAMLRYGQDPEGTMKYLKRELNLRFNHSRIVEGRKPTHPTKLSENRISFEIMKMIAFTTAKNLQGVEDRGLTRLEPEKLDEIRLRDLLSRLRRPDLPDLPALIFKDLRNKHSRGFGSHGIHRNLTKDQMDELLQFNPKFIDNSNFVHSYLSKLAPSADVDPRQDDKEMSKWLSRQLGFTRRLSPAFNSLKANVMHELLVFKRKQGEWDRESFLEYLKLPRIARYVNDKWMNEEVKRRRDCQVFLNADYSSKGAYPKIGNDDSLVRSYLLHFSIQDKNYEGFVKYVRDDYLKKIFAEAKLTAGVGNPETWYSMLNSGEVRVIRERIDLDFAHSNKERFSPGEEVNVKLWTKNVETLLVKEFEINAFNYYLGQGREIDTAIELDGLSATRERTLTFEEAPMRRVSRTFAFPELKKRGVYVIEFIGNGISSRILVRKGTLRLLEKTGPAGHEFHVIDEANKPRPQATAWLDGKEYEPDEQGVITIPFSTRAGQKTAVLRDGDFSSLARFKHLGESYKLDAGIYVDRETLLSRKKAQVLVRPSLRINGRPTSLDLLKEIKLVVLAVDYEGIPNRSEIAIEELKEGEEFVHEVKVPEKLLQMSVTLEAKIENLSLGKKQNLSDSATFAINAIEQGSSVNALHLGWSDDGYFLDVLGKNGEPLVDHPVVVEIKHLCFKRVKPHSLKTDQSGRITLGNLPEIQWISARNTDEKTYRWPIFGQREGRIDQPNALHASTEEEIKLAVSGSWAQGNERKNCSLLERKAGLYVSDLADRATHENGFLTLKGLAPGDYELFLKETGETIGIRVTAGQRRFGFVASANRILEDNRPTPLQITGLSVKNGKVRVQVANGHAFARVHLLATRYAPRFDVHNGLANQPLPNPTAVRLNTPKALYVAERDIGEEYRYVLERAQAEKFPGNMLGRPGLILNPWAVRKTSTTLQDAREGGDYAELSDSDDMQSLQGNSGGHDMLVKGGLGSGDFASLDFLRNNAFLATNLKIGKDGTVEIDLPENSGLRQVRVVVTDPVQVASATLALPDSPIVRRELRMTANLDPEKSFSEQKRLTIVDAGEAFELADATTSRLHLVDDLRDAHDLLLTIREDATLREFAFVLDWPGMKEEQKRGKYSKYACHELNFFLLQKDLEFFNRVVKPYLANKKEPTFLDDWFLGHDLGKYLDPFRFGQLNAFEKILLARKGPAEAVSMARYVRDKWELIPPDPEKFDRLFDVALKTSALKGEESKQLAVLNSLQSDGREKVMKSLSLGGREAFKIGNNKARYSFSGGVPPAAPPPPSGSRPTADFSAAPMPSPAKGAQRTEAVTERAFANDGESNFGRDKSKVMDESRRASVPASKPVATAGYFATAEKKRAQVRQFFRQLDATEEWAENNYYHVSKERTNGSLIEVNAFWRDYASTQAGKPFFSGNLVYATRNFSEMLLVLAVLDLPFEAGDHDADTEDRTFKLKAKTSLIAFHEELLEGEAPKGRPDVLLSQRFYRFDSRFRYENGERVDNFIDQEFLKGIAHGCHVTLTNPTSSRRKLRLLLQIPTGAIPLKKGYFSKSFPVTMEGYSTRTFDYSFYFPEPGNFPIYPAQVSGTKGTVARTEPFSFTVVRELSRKDKGSWAWISQNGSDKDVLRFLSDNNLNRLDLSKIAFRMKEQGEGGSGRAFYEKTLEQLGGRFHFDSTLWSYAVYHKDEPRIREFLTKSSFANNCGKFLRSPLLNVDPVERHWYEQLEYEPLVNARTHQLGKKREIVNNRFYEQYHRLLEILKYKAAPDSDDVLAATYYHFLQDRVEEGIRFFGKIDRQTIDEKLQYDYLASYVAFYKGDVAGAKKLASKYADYPVERWRKRFASVSAQVKEIEQGDAPKVIDEENREQKIENLAATEPAFDFEVEKGEVTINYRNLKDARVNFYPMEVELLFSRRPFVSDASEQFTFVQPNGTQKVKLPAGENHVFALPEKYREGNVMIEIEAGGVRKSKTYYANRLQVEMTESYGRVRVTEDKTAKPLSSTYVKVYARMNDGRVKFYKDGYTDFRGKFDYASLNTGQLDGVDRFAVLVLDEQAGAMIREVKPPKQ